MAQQGKSDDLITLQELTVSNAYEVAVLFAGLQGVGPDLTAYGTEASNVDTIPRRLKA